MRLWAVQVVLLSHNDVLNVFHREVITESVIQQSLKLIHGQFLHVALETQKTLRKVQLAEDNLWPQHPQMIHVCSRSTKMRGAHTKPFSCQQHKPETESIEPRNITYYSLSPKLYNSP